MGMPDHRDRLGKREAHANMAEERKVGVEEDAEETGLHALTKVIGAIVQSLIEDVEGTLVNQKVLSLRRTT